MNKQRKRVSVEGLQRRAEELKELTEQRAELMTQIKAITEAAGKEQRAFSAEESTSFDELEEKIKSIDTTMAQQKRAKALTLTERSKNESEGGDEEALKVRAFEDYLRGTLNERSTENLTTGDNGVIIPTSIAQKIIKRVYDICPVYAGATRYTVKGNLTIPYYDEDAQAITMAFADEFNELESHIGKHTSITLSGFLAGALAKISKSLINNSQFDVVSEVIENMAQTIARFVENALLNGVTGKVEGLTGITTIKTAAAASVITMDELIELKDSIKDAYQNKAIFIMKTATRTAIRKLKDSTGRYLMQDDITSPFGTVLLGKPVFVSDNMPGMETGKKAIIYGDMSGLAVKLSEEANIQILQEKYAGEHAVGVIAWMEFDAKVENTQKLACLKMA